MSTLKPFDSVALLSAKPDSGLAQGQVGTIVEALGGGAFLVEFSGDDGKAYAIVPLFAQDLFRLKFAAEATE